LSPYQCFFQLLVLWIQVCPQIHIGPRIDKKWNACLLRHPPDYPDPLALNINGKKGTRSGVIIFEIQSYHSGLYEQFDISLQLNIIASISTLKIGADRYFYNPRDFSNTR